jgi:hypothetical protein
MIFADVLRVAFLIAAGLYFGFAFAVMRRYVYNPPRSKLRKAHVWSVSGGTSLLIIGLCGLVLERFGEPLAWYGAPIGFVGLVCVLTGLVLLFRDQSEYVQVNRKGDDIPRRERRRSWLRRRHDNRR